MKAERVQALIIGLLFLAYGCQHDGAQAPRTAPVKRGSLTLSVDVRGELEAENSVNVRCPKLYWGRDGRRGGNIKIIKLIPEGAEVKPGDLLVELDKADLKDNLRKSESDVREKTADLEKARKTLLVEREKLRAEVEKLRADLEIKQIAQNTVEALPTVSDAISAQTQLETAQVIAQVKQQDYDPTLKLYKTGHVTQQDLEIAELKWKQAQIDLQRKKIIYDLVMKGADACEKKRVALDVQLAQIALAQAQTRLEYETKKLEEQIKAAEADLELARFEMKRRTEALEDADIKAPCAGTVIYARVFQSSGEEKIAEGSAVWTFSTIIHLPDLNSMVAKVYVEESQIHLIREGLPAIIKMDAIKDMEFHGRVVEISNVTRDKAETRGLVSWLYGKGELGGSRVFQVKVRIGERDKRIRPGLNGDVKIISEQLKDVLHIPVEAVFRREGREFAYVKQGRRFVQRPIKTGKAAEGMVVILDGLKEGEEVSLVEPSL